MVKLLGISMLRMPCTLRATAAKKAEILEVHGPGGQPVSCQFYSYELYLQLQYISAKKAWCGFTF
jgi:hypothetical protein